MKREELLKTVDIKDFSSWKQIILDDQKLLETLEKLQIKPSHLPKYTIDELKDELKNKMDFPKRIILEIEDLMKEIKDEIERRDSERTIQILVQKKETKKMERELREDIFEIEQENGQYTENGESDSLRKDWITFYSSQPQFGNKDFLDQIIPFHVNLKLRPNAVLNGTTNVEDYLIGLKNSIYFESVSKYFQTFSLSRKRIRSDDLDHKSEEPIPKKTLKKKNPTSEIFCKCCCEQCKNDSLDKYLPIHTSICPNSHDHIISTHDHNCLSGCVSQKKGKKIKTQTMRVSNGGLVSRSTSLETHLKNLGIKNEIEQTNSESFKNSEDLHVILDDFKISNENEQTTYEKFNNFFEDDSLELDSISTSDNSEINLGTPLDWSKNEKTSETNQTIPENSNSDFFQFLGNEIFDLDFISESTEDRFGLND
jgi:hypothetical protein